MRKGFLFFLFLISACLFVSAQSWQRVGPEGGNIAGLARHPHNPNEMLAVSAADISQVFRTTNGGETWQRIATVNMRVTGIAYDPVNPNTVYAAPYWYNRILKSTNGGGNWSEIPIGSSWYAAGGLVVDPANPATIYVGGFEYYTSDWLSRMAVFKSVNGGATWSIIRVGPAERSGRILSLVCAPSDSRILYLSGESWTGSQSVYRVYKSSDMGVNWQEITGGIPTRVGVMAVDPHNASRVYAGTSWGIYRSSDGGATWTRNSGTAYADGLAVDPANTNTLHAGHGNRYFKSPDGGVNWTLTQHGLAGTCRTILATTTGVFFGSSAGVYGSRDGGNTWTASCRGLFAVEVASIGFSASSPNIVYTEGKGNGFFKSTNFGSSWQRMPDFYRCDSINQILVNPANGQDLYILAGG